METNVAREPDVRTMYPVASSNVAEIGYSAARLELYIRFKSGGFYTYFEVPGEVWEGLRAAESKGVYVHTHLARRREDGSLKYRFTRQ
jgi:hypothetical protein